MDGENDGDVEADVQAIFVGVNIQGTGVERGFWTADDLVQALVDVLDHLDDHVPVFEEVESMIFEGPFRVLVLCDQVQ